MGLNRVTPPSDELPVIGVACLGAGVLFATPLALVVAVAVTVVFVKVTRLLCTGGVLNGSLLGVVTLPG